MKKTLNARVLKEIAKNYQGRHRVPIQTIILRLLYASGVIGAALIAPNSIQLLRFIDPTLEKDKRAWRRVSQAMTRLKQQKLVVLKAEGVELTERGNAKIEEILSNAYQVPEPVLWDGKWRVIMFDIPEKKRHAREKLRSLLHGAGFLRLQDSVWIYPYACDEFITLVRTHLRSARGELVYLTADFFDSDKMLREHFRIS